MNKMILLGRYAYKSSIVDAIVYLATHTLYIT